MKTSDLEINIENEDIIPKFIQNVGFVQTGLKVVQTNNEEILKLKEQHAAATLLDKEKRLFILWMIHKLNRNKCQIEWVVKQ